nr:zinc-finger homeodomain protein 3-like [Coffea arabica]
MSIYWSQGISAAEMNIDSQKGNENGKATVNFGAVSMHSSPEDHRLPNKKALKYMECLKNHAAAAGGHATDGCGEFLPGGEEGTIEALKCSACNCHRNFHRKVIEGDCSSQSYHSFFLVNGEKLFTSAHQHNTTHQVTLAPPKVQLLQTSEKDEQEEGVHPEAKIRPHDAGKRRSRTKFSQEQKEKLWSFAEKVGWKIQKADDSAVNGFCQEIGIRRRVLKVWMHNNKHNLAKKNSYPC